MGKENLEWGRKKLDRGREKKALERIKKTEGTGRDKRKYDTRREKWDREKANTKFELGGGGKVRRNRREEEGGGKWRKNRGGIFFLSVTDSFSLPLLSSSHY